MVEIDTIYNEDCLIGMDRIPDKSIDMILCDLPYGVLNRQNEHAQWDNIIPFEPLWIQYRRVIKDNGAIVLFGQGMFTADLMTSQRNMWGYNLIWNKTDRPTGFLNAKKMPLREHEDIMVFYKEPLCTIHRWSNVNRISAIIQEVRWNLNRLIVVMGV